MADPFVAEIRVFPFSFAPRGWATCDGQLMPISQNTALFSLLGTTYGGDGRSTFALPDLRGRAPMHPGQGPGLSLHDLGEAGGEEQVTLTQGEMPAHSHALQVSAATATLRRPAGDRVLAAATDAEPWSSATDRVALAPQALTAAGGGQPHPNMQPYLTFTFCIALQGVFPPRG